MLSNQTSLENNGISNNKNDLQAKSQESDSKISEDSKTTKQSPGRKITSSKSSKKARQSVSRMRKKPINSSGSLLKKHQRSSSLSASPSPKSTKKKKKKKKKKTKSIVDLNESDSQKKTKKKKVKKVKKKKSSLRERIAIKRMKELMNSASSVALVSNRSMTPLGKKSKGLLRMNQNISKSSNNVKGISKKRKSYEDNDNDIEDDDNNSVKSSDVTDDSESESDNDENDDDENENENNKSETGRVFLMKLKMEKKEKMILSLGKKLEEMVEKCKGLEKKMEGKEKEVVEKNEELRELEMVDKKMKIEIIQMKEKMEKSEKKRKLMEEKNDMNEKEVKKLIKEKEEWRATNVEIEGKNEEILKKINMIESKNETLKEENERMNVKIKRMEKSFENEKETMLKTNQRLSMEKDSTEKKYKEIIKYLKEEISVLTAEKKENDENEISFSRESSKKKKELLEKTNLLLLEQLTRKEMELEMEIEKNNMMKNREQCNDKESKERCLELEEKIRILEGDLSGKKKHISGLEADISRITKENVEKKENLKERLRTISKSFSELKEDFEIKVKKDLGFLLDSGSSGFFGIEKDKLISEFSRQNQFLIRVEEGKKKRLREEFMSNQNFLLEKFDSELEKKNKEMEILMNSNKEKDLQYKKMLKNLRDSATRQEEQEKEVMEILHTSKNQGGIIAERSCNVIFEKVSKVAERLNGMENKVKRIIAISKLKIMERLSEIKSEEKEKKEKEIENNNKNNNKEEKVEEENNNSNKEKKVAEDSQHNKDYHSEEDSVSEDDIENMKELNDINNFLREKLNKLSKENSDLKVENLKNLQIFQEKIYSFISQKNNLESSLEKLQDENFIKSKKMIELQNENRKLKNDKEKSLREFENEGNNHIKTLNILRKNQQELKERILEKEQLLLEERIKCGNFEVDIKTLTDEMIKIENEKTKLLGEIRLLLSEKSTTECRCCVQ